MKRTAIIKLSALATILFVFRLNTAADGSVPDLPQPVITPVSEWCFDDALTLTHNVTGYSGYTHTWQYGFYTTVWYPVPGFSGFVTSMMYSLGSYYSENPYLCEGCDITRIQSAAYTTDYGFMNQYFPLYADINNNRPTIAQLILDGIGVQNQHLTEAERAFLTTSYYYVANDLAGITWLPANLPNQEIISWNPLGETSNESITFVPGSLFAQAAPDKVAVGFKVCISTGPYSPVEEILIKPQPPSFSVASIKSCPDYASGQISLSGINGVAGINKYELNVIKIGEQSGPSFKFEGTSYTVPQLFSVGTYSVYLYYDNGDGCSLDNKTLSVEGHPDLDFEITQVTNASCPGTSDGTITVEKNTSYGDYQFSIGTYYLGINTNGTFYGLPAGEYRVYGTDGCHTVKVPSPAYNITEPPIVSINSIVKTDPTCYSTPNGGFTIKASGGNNQYTYQIANALNAIVASVANEDSEWTCSGLTGGNYTVRVSSGGCTPVVSAVQALAVVTPVTFSTSITPVDCYGFNTGSIGVTASGGNKDYRYSLDNINFTTSSLFKDLSSGNYHLWVKTTATACNDFANGDVFVGTAPKIEIAFSQVLNPSCFEKDDGKITASVSGGIGPYSYSWEQSGFPVPGSSNTIENLFPETYKVNIRDSKNCLESKEVVLTEPPELIVTSATPTDAVCFGENGSIKVQATGGSGGYLYSNQESTGYTGSSTVNLPPGNYGIYVRDANGCLASYGETLTITGPVSPLDFTWSSPEFNSFNIACSGNATGSLSVLASGGNGLKSDGSSYTGYYYSLAGSPNQSSSIFPALTAGTFNLKVTDGRGCIVQKLVTLSEPDPLTLNLVSSVPVKCSGDVTGELIVTASGGIENSWVYSLDGTEMLTSGIFKNLQARTYEIEVTDLNGCSKNMFATVESPYSPINISAVEKDVSCFGEGNGEITTSVTGGAGGFSFAWEKQSGENWLPIGGTTGSRTDMLPGTYRVRAIDSENCFGYGLAEISEPPPLQITGVSSEDIVCFGETGSLHINGSGGTGEYKYLYSTGGSNYESNLQDITVPSGVYTISLKDANECLSVHPQTLSITSPAEPLSFNYVLSDYSGYNISCHGKDDGIINVLASGGNGAEYSGYSYNITGRSPDSENIFTGLKAGTYDITISDARGCSMTKPVTLLEPASFINLGASSIKHPVCANDNNGAITLEASGGSSPYTYSVNDSDLTESAEFLGLKADSYTFMVRDRNGCIESYNTQLTNVVSEMSVTGSIRDVGCYGETSGEINLSVTGGAKPYSYLWKETLSTTPLVNKLKTGSYTVLITDSAGCSAEKMFHVNQPEKPLSVSAISSPACVELENGLIEATGSGGTPPYSYSIGNRSAVGRSSSFNTYSGDHNVFISDLNNCLAETRIHVDVKNTKPDVNFMLATSRYELDTLVVIDVSVPPPDRVTWEFSQEADVIETGNNRARVRYNSSGLYPVKMTGHFGSCPYTIEKLLNIAPFDPSVIPDKDNRDGIRSVKISPNPNDGRFELNVELYTRQKVTVRIFDMSSRILYTEYYPPDINFLKEINLPEAVMPGTYVLHVTSENDSRTVVFVISE